MFLAFHNWAMIFHYKKQGRKGRTIYRWGNEDIVLSKDFSPGNLRSFFPFSWKNIINRINRLFKNIFPLPKIICKPWKINKHFLFSSNILWISNFYSLKLEYKDKWNNYMFANTNSFTSRLNNMLFMRYCGNNL